MPPACSLPVANAAGSRRSAAWARSSTCCVASEGGLSHFDHALNASLVVAYLALRQGDAAGL
ncbi:hypothetical protein C7E18_21335, partial [Stenotrophomonas maltophilia]